MTQKIYDWQNKLHTVELEVTNDADEPAYRYIEAKIDGVGELIVNAHWSDVPKAMHDMITSVNFFLDGHHTPSHYTGKLAGLARYA